MNELPKRKSIRLKNYDYSQNGCYFITICTNNRECLFNIRSPQQSTGDYARSPLRKSLHNTLSPDEMIEKWLLELEKKFADIKINEYVIMPNHIHFILEKCDGDFADNHAGSSLRQSNKVNIQEIVAWFKTMTTNEYIKNVKQNVYTPFDKKLWQSSFYEHVIRNEYDYVQVAEYIRNNPLKWEEDKEFRS